MWRWDQAEPFGASPANDDPDGNSVAFDLPLRLPGQRYDAETGLHYNYFRDYDPTLGIYKQSDLVGLRGALNTYAYVGGDPLSFVDPTGERRLWNRFNPRDMAELQKNLPPYMIEEGAKSATNPEEYGEVVGKYLCKTIGGRVKSAFYSCSQGGPHGGGCGIFLGVDGGVGAHQDCIDACHDYIKRACNPNCPI